LLKEKSQRISKWEGVIMAGKNFGENLEKEAIRRHLLASTICPADTGGLKGSHGRWARLWQILFAKSRMH
jgi:hypothetical protein